MPAKRTETCYYCRFWQGHGLKERGPKGSCRRFPPAVTPRHPDGAFPVTMATDWCGEWQRVAGRPVESDQAAMPGLEELERPLFGDRDG